MFTLADKRKDRADALSPPIWKATIASGLAIYPLILFLFPAIEPYIEDLPHWLGSIVTVGIITPVSTLIMIPAVTWVLKNWLYKQPPEG